MAILRVDSGWIAGGWQEGLHGRRTVHRYIALYPEEIKRCHHPDVLGAGSGPDKGEHRVDFIISGGCGRL